MIDIKAVLFGVLGFIVIVSVVVLILPFLGYLITKYLDWAFDLMDNWKYRR